MVAYLIHEHSALVQGSDGIVYRALIFGAPRDDGTWIGWIEFQPVNGGVSLRTDQETSQPDRHAVDYWAGGLEPIYLEGALARAERFSAVGEKPLRGSPSSAPEVPSEPSAGINGAPLP